ncbi:PTS fructose transporter subunit IIA [Bombilactobacillus bombi]|uniref:PTS fructose transporter subunit IIA n=1 Tax=Bombilactobacillus bombi TaxID=1303590 RepID=A0A3R6Z8Z9_9LACO|nr:PTS fructose transporter subunit IIA [Bombilactobacillus bombi]RHW46293.1 PTS fructose transporter subunit IIA [Bombilactobacillus bombi]
MKLILVSHGHLAKGMKNTLEMIVGHQDNVIALSAYGEENNDFKTIVTKEIESNSHQPIVILTDILGGSVNTELSKMVIQYEDVFLITGMNLSLALTLVTYAGTFDVKNISRFVAESQKSIIFMNQAIQQASEEEEL